jgi:hypothetical protein
MHLLSILPDRRSGNAAYHNQYWICIFWLVSEGLLHDRKLLLNLPSGFGSPSQQVLLLPTQINSAIVIHHITLSLFRRYHHHRFGSLLERKLNPIFWLNFTVKIEQKKKK